jgi:hypothetical protein
MRLSLYGWGRYVLNHDLINFDVSDLELSRDRTYFGDQAYIERHDPESDGEPDGLELVAKASNVSLNGDFLVRVRLTKDEIANLARIAFRDDPFADVVAALSTGHTNTPSSM